MKRLLLPWIAAIAWAQPGPPPPTVSASATATATAKPDLAIVDVGVFSRAQTAQAAAAANAKQLTGVIDALRKELGQAADIRTTGYSLNPEYHHPREGGTPSITGYTASNVVEVSMKDVAAVGRIIDVATRAGANNIHNVRFLLQDEPKVRTEALREAARKARASAEAIAGALNVRVVRVLSAEEGFTQPPRPLYNARMQEMAASAVPTPVEPGSITIQSTVTVTLEVAQ